MKFTPSGAKRGKKNYCTFESINHLLLNSDSVFRITSHKTDRVLKINQDFGDFFKHFVLQVTTYC